MADITRALERVAEAASELIPHHFETITALDDGTSIPPEALSEDHTVGLYPDVIPCKMRESLGGFRDVGIADFVPQTLYEKTTTGMVADWFLEFPPLRNVRFRAERLQFLEEGWWAVTAEVKYPAETVLGLMRLMKNEYGSAHLCVNEELPMPLWIRSAPLGSEVTTVQAVVQARGEGRVLLTNIHTECTMEYARRFAEAARSYYRTPAL